MTKLKITPAAEPSVADAERAVTERTAELATIRTDIAAGQAALPALALDPDDAKFETKSLEIDRLKRAQLRASARLDQARVALTDAKAREKEDRRKARYDAGEKAVSEIETLTAKYTEHAGAIVEILREIDRRAEVIEVANNNRADYAPWLEVPQLALSVRLPIGGGEYGWLWPEAQNAEPATVTNAPFANQPAKQEARQHGERILDDGTRIITLPAGDWATPREYVTETQSRSSDAN